MIQIMFEELMLAGSWRTLKLTAGQTVFRQGAASTSFHQVKAGRVRLVRSLSDGIDVTLAVAGPGESFAEAALFSDRYHCDAIADTDCEVIVLSAAAIRKKLANDPKSASKLAAFLAGQVRELRARLEIRNIKLAPSRVMAWLRIKATGKPPTLELGRPWAAIATEIGLTPEAVYRALAELEQTGTITRRGKRSIVLSAKGQRK